MEWKLYLEWHDIPEEKNMESHLDFFFTKHHVEFAYNTLSANYKPVNFEGFQWTVPE